MPIDFCQCQSELVARQNDSIPRWHLVIDSTKDVAHLRLVVSPIGVLSGKPWVKQH